MTAPAEPSPTRLARDFFSTKVETALESIQTRTNLSWRLALDQTQFTPKPIDAHGIPAVSLYAHSSQGAFLTDVDNNKYIDLCMGFGALILGHAHSTVQHAIGERLSRGWQLGLPNTDQLELAKLIQAAGPANERVVICNSSADALDVALRAARAFSGKPITGALTSARHGTVPANEGFAFGPRLARGLPTASDQDRITFPYGHSSVFDLIHRRKRDLAAIVLEPVRGCEASASHIAWLHQLAEVCREANVILIFDEAATGFRLAFGGTQEAFGLVPDLVTYGNIVGGGLPLGAVAGRADILSPKSSGFSHAQSPLNKVSAGNPLSVSAGLAALSHLKENQMSVYPALNRLGGELAREFNTFAKTESLPVEMKNIGSLSRIVFQTLSRDDQQGGAQNGFSAPTALSVLMLNRGVIAHASHRSALSLAHTDEDMRIVCAAFKDSLRDLHADGFFEAGS